MKRTVDNFAALTRSKAKYRGPRTSEEISENYMSNGWTVNGAAEKVKLKNSLIEIAGMLGFVSGLIVGSVLTGIIVAVILI